LFGGDVLIMKNYEFIALFVINLLFCVILILYFGKDNKMKKKRKLIFLYLSVTLSIVAIFVIVSSLFFKITINSISKNIKTEYIEDKELLISDKTIITEDEKI
jgi:hypothetical protein